MGARTAEDSGWRELAVKKEKGKDRTGIGVRELLGQRKTLVSWPISHLIP